MSASASALDMGKLNEFVGRFVTDLGATVHAGMVVIGEKLGLYKALATGAMTPAELATKTKTDERYIREWLASQAAGGYVTYDDKSGKFSLNAEQAFTMANEDSPAYLPGAFELALGSLAAVPRIVESFRSGAGMGWHEHSESVFHGCEKFFRPGYTANLVSAWIPALSGVKEKLEAGAMILDLSLISLPPVIECAIAQVTPLVKAKGLNLTLEIASDLPWVEADENKLERVLVNLLANAIKFTSSGGSICLRAHSDMEAKSVKFCVKDTGEGIPPEAHGKIFEKFGQVKTRESGRQMSSGLGLTFCKLAIEAHGGHIGVESVPGEGSEFCFSIPLAVPVESE